MIKIKDLKNYEEYIELQKEKTTDPKRRAIWELALRDSTKKFIPTFHQYIDCFEQFKEGKVFCLGARTGEEALALRLLGFKNSLGTDLVPFGKHVIEDDIHNMQFEDGSVSFFYTNIFDHSINPDKFIGEIERCLIPNGRAFFQLQIGTENNQLDKYGVCSIETPKDFHSLVESKDLSVYRSEPNTVLTPHNHGLNWNIILEKVEK